MAAAVMPVTAASSASAGPSFAPVHPGASLLLSFRPTGRTVLVLGTRRLAASRIACLLEADARPVVVGVDVDNTTQASSSSGDLSTTELTQCPHASDEVRWRVSQRQCEYLSAPLHDTEEDWQKLIAQVDGSDRSLFAVCITDTLHVGDDDEFSGEVSAKSGQKPSQPTRLAPVARARLVASICKTRRIPINVADRPELCDFSFPATHRFGAVHTDALTRAAADEASARVPASLQIAVTTNGKGCRLAGRIRREIVASLPSNVGDAVERIGAMRDLAKGRVQHPARPEAAMAHARNGHHSARNTGQGHRESSMRRQALFRTTSTNTTTANGTTGIDADEEDLAFDNTPLNSPVPQLNSPSEFDFRNIAIEAGDGSNDAAGAAVKLQQQYEALVEERRRRMRWVAQMSEYWPIEYLGSLSHKDMTRALDTFQQEGGNANLTQEEGDQRGRCAARNTSEATPTSASYTDNKNVSRRAESQHSLTIRKPTVAKRGHIYLVGSGTGHPGLLTSMAYQLLTSSDTDLILSDKLVPAQILSLIPKSTPLRIARKFPGNAEGAQSELIQLALEGAQQGKRVVRLKQGDPFIYGRGGEEVLAFRREGIEATVLPGISSALAAPLLLGIPVTQRGAADSMTLCTGVGRGGKSVALPGYERGRSLVVLMGVARLRDVVATLCHGWKSSLIEVANAAAASPEPAGQRLGSPFPPYTPIAIIERASSSDQRLVASTLENVESALARSGEQRPPGMMLIGWTVLSLHGAGNVDVLDDETECRAMGEEGPAELERRDRARVRSWLGTSGFLVREGLDAAYKSALIETPSFATYVDPLGSHPREHSFNEAATSSSFSPLHTSAADNTSDRDASGWAPPRYAPEGQPRGGWGHGEMQCSDSFSVMS